MPENLRLRHDCCQALATACVEPVAHLYREEERRELHRLFYEAAQAALVYYDRHALRETSRLTPSGN
jgi:hypothetical protein